MLKKKKQKTFKPQCFLELLHNTGFGLVSRQLGGVSRSLCNSHDTIQRSLLMMGILFLWDLRARWWWSCLCCVCEAFAFAWELLGAYLTQASLPWLPLCWETAVSSILHIAADVILMPCMCRGGQSPQKLVFSIICAVSRESIVEGRSEAEHMASSIPHRALWVEVGMDIHSLVSQGAFPAFAPEFNNWKYLNRFSFVLCIRK